MAEHTGLLPFGVESEDTMKIGIECELDRIRQYFGVLNETNETL